MKKFCLLLLLIAIFSTTYAQKLVILHTNDMHSKITGFGPEKAYTPMSINNDSTRGGFARLATLIASEKKKNKGDVLVCDAGDFLMGSVFQVLEPSTGFQLDLMKKIGYDIVTIGNHEYDFGTDKLGDIINSAKKNGKIPQIVQSQMQFSATSKKDDKLAALVKDNTIKPYVIFTRNGLKIGVFGIIGADAQHVAPNSKPLTFSDITNTAAKMTKLLREQKKS